MQPFNNPLPGIPLIESPLFEKMVQRGCFPPDMLPVARQLHENGYAIIDFPDADFDARAERIKARLLQEVGNKAGQSHDNRDIEAGQRLTDMWTVDADVKALATNAGITSLLSTLYGRKAFPVQTLNFPKGSQQPHHMDSYYFSTIPERFMCGVWVALEDIDEQQGPLSFCPGSHKFPSYQYQHVGLSKIDYQFTTQKAMHPAWDALVEAHQLHPKQFIARKGQALIWCANLLHGGMPHLDPAQTRWTQVTHYFFEDCAYYLPNQSDPFRGQLRFIEPLNLASGNRIAAAFNGEAIPQEFVEKSLHGFHEQRRERFDEAAYLLANPDVAASSMDPWLHYVEHGRKEGRPFPRRSKT